MIRTSRAKRLQFISLILGTVVVMGGLWYALIRPQQAKLETQRGFVDEANKISKTVKHNAELMFKYKRDEQIARKGLDSLESKMASGDVYRWVIRTFSDEQRFPNVELSNFEPPRTSDASPQSKVHYRVASFSISGTALYHDFGKYLAHLENRFPNLRIQKLELENSHPGDTTSEDAEKLNFKIDVALPVKPETN